MIGMNPTTASDPSPCRVGKDIDTNVSYFFPSFQVLVSFSYRFGKMN